MTTKMVVQLLSDISFSGSVQSYYELLSHLRGFHLLQLVRALQYVLQLPKDILQRQDSWTSFSVEWFYGGANVFGDSLDNIFLF